MSVPCRVCGCIAGEPGLCHAVVPSGRACFRVPGYVDWCSACGTWDKTLTINFPTMPIEAKAAHHRAHRCEQAAFKRGNAVEGSYALRVHAAQMRRKANRLCAEAGLIDPAYKNPPPERDLPLCPPASA